MTLDQPHTYKYLRFGGDGEGEQNGSPDHLLDLFRSTDQPLVFISAINGVLHHLLKGFTCDHRPFFFTWLKIHKPSAAVDICRCVELNKGI